MAVLAVVGLAAVLIYDAVYNKTAETSFFAMNTYTAAQVKGQTADSDCEMIEKIVSRLDTEVLSRTSEDSLIYKINSSGEGRLDEAAAEYFSALLDVCEKSGGAFDITLGAVSDLWGFGGNPSVPDEAALSETLSHSGCEKVNLSNGKITLGDPEAVLDFGAAGKGIALDAVKSYLDTQKSKRAVVSVGGSVLLYGEGEFTVGIRNPEGNSTDCIANLHITEGCVSTSGIYEQNFEEGGKTYHHILDPETGYPVDNGLISVTVISDSGLLSDALSTACFVLGIEKGFELAREYGATVFFVSEDKTIYALSDSADLLELNDPDYKINEF